DYVVGGFAKQRLEAHPEFDARQCGAKAEMDPMAEGEVLRLRSALQVELVWILEDLRIPIRGSEDYVDRLPLLDRLAAEIDVLYGAADDNLDGSVVPLQFVDRPLQRLSVAAKKIDEVLALVGESQQVQETVADGVCRGLVPAVQQK